MAEKHTQETAEENAGYSVPDEELADALKIPAVLSQRIVVSNTPSGLRMAFGEIGLGPGQTNFRFATLVPYGDAFSLLELLQRQLAKVQAVDPKDLLDDKKS